MGFGKRVERGSSKNQENCGKGEGNWWLTYYGLVPTCLHVCMYLEDREVRGDLLLCGRVWWIFFWVRGYQPASQLTMTVYKIVPAHCNGLKAQLQEGWRDRDGGQGGWWPCGYAYRPITRYLCAVMWTAMQLRFHQVRLFTGARVCN